MTFFRKVLGCDLEVFNGEITAEAAATTAPMAVPRCCPALDQRTAEPHRAAVTSAFQYGCPKPVSE